VDDVSLPGRELVIRGGKGGKDRLTFFDKGTRQQLARYLVKSRPFLARKEETALIVNDHGRRLQDEQLGRLVRTHAERAGIGRPVTPLTLRHSFCTNLLRHGANLKVIAELAGHGSLNTTAGYTRVDIGELSAVYRSAHPRSGG
jgi:integrase/recombinase XerD